MAPSSSIPPTDSGTSIRPHLHLPLRLPKADHPPPGVADMVDKAEEGAEAETDEEHHRLRFREVSAPPRNTPFLQARMALINLAKGWMLPMPARLGRCMFVPVILSL